MTKPGLQFVSVCFMCIFVFDDLYFMQFLFFVSLDLLSVYGFSLGFNFDFSLLAKGLARISRKSVSDMTYLLSSGAFHLN